MMKKEKCFEIVRRKGKCTRLLFSVRYMVREKIDVFFQFITETSAFIDVQKLNFKESFTLFF